ncbi:MAG: hypothetical protein QNJ92_06855 [Alphaproteobacteria bacterium]|nr:hypothetical protein [Alphaproteobacteria bacterium]
MTTPAELRALIKRLEKAEGPSLKLNAEIAVACRVLPVSAPKWVDTNFPTWRARKDGRVEVVHTDGTGGTFWEPAHYTGSLDAALTLVPEGWMFSELRRNHEYNCWAAKLRYGPRPDIGIALGEHNIGYLALCIAALRARLAQIEGKG